MTADATAIRAFRRLGLGLPNLEEMLCLRDDPGPRSPQDNTYIGPQCL